MAAPTRAGLAPWLSGPAPGRRSSVDSASAPPAAAAAMAAEASPEPDTAEVLPQHKFDSGALEAYLSHHLPGFAAEPEATLTIAQYRYRRRLLLQQKQICALCFFSLWPWGGVVISPIPAAFPAVTHCAGGGCRPRGPLAFPSGHLQFEDCNGSTSSAGNLFS